LEFQAQLNKKDGALHSNYDTKSYKYVTLIASPQPLSKGEGHF
jgi:hypothetical protein